MSAEKTDLFLIILNYNNGKDTIDCIRSIEAIRAKNETIQYHIVVVDNGSNDDSLEQIKTHSDATIHLIESPDNLGYAGGNNIGIRYAIESGADIVCILNNDVIVNSSSFLPCVEALLDNDELGIVGPVILDYGTNIIQSAGANIDYLKLKTPFINYKKTYTPENIIQYCDYVGGACMLFQPALVEKIGYLPEGYFLFWEETEWCQKAKKAGSKIGCIYAASVQHKGSATINKTIGTGTHYLECNRVVFSRRNSPSHLIHIAAVVRLCFRAVFQGLTKDKVYFSFIKYYFEGLTKNAKF